MRHQKGGDIIGKGSYGCVFKPAIKCEGDALADPSMISKLMSDREANTELNIYTKIDAIDPTFIFHLPTPKKCSPDMEHLSSQEDIDTCEIYNLTHKKSSNQSHKSSHSSRSSQRSNTISDLFDDMNTTPKLQLLQMKYGGQSLYEFMKSHDPEFMLNQLTNILHGMYPLMIGLDEMAKHDIYHLDIKVYNIVVEPDTFHFKYIDFGLSNNFENIFNDASFFVDNPYFAYPSEIAFVPLYNYLREILDTSLVQKKQQEKNKYEKELLQARQIGEKYKNAFNQLTKQTNPEMKKKKDVLRKKYTSHKRVISRIEGKLAQINRQLGDLQSSHYRYTNSVKDHYESVDMNNFIKHYLKDNNRIYTENATNDSIQKYRNYYEFCKENQSGSINPSIMFLKQLLKQVDTFSLGLCLLQFFQGVFSIVFENEIYDIDDFIRKPFYPHFTRLGYSLSDNTQNALIILYELIIRMIQPLFMERIQPNKSREVFENIIQLLGTDALYRGGKRKRKTRNHKKRQKKTRKHQKRVKKNKTKNKY